MVLELEYLTRGHHHTRHHHWASTSFTPWHPRSVSFPVFHSRAPPPLPGGFVRIIKRPLEVDAQHRDRPPAIADPFCDFVVADNKRAVARGTDQVLLDDFARSLLLGGHADADAFGLSLATRANDREPSVATLIAAVCTGSIKHRGALQAAIRSTWFPDALEGHAIHWC